QTPCTTLLIAKGHKEGSAPSGFAVIESRRVKTYPLPHVQSRQISERENSAPQWAKGGPRSWKKNSIVGKGCLPCAYFCWLDEVHPTCERYDRTDTEVHSDQVLFAASDATVKVNGR